MLNEFFSICDKLNFSKKKLLVAVSGGVDSMVLCHLLKKLNLDFSIAHVNYNLRGNDSYLDEKFISEYTNKNQIDLFLKNVDLSDQKNSIQNKAREIRFSFFNEILSKYNFEQSVVFVGLLKQPRYMMERIEIIPNFIPEEQIYGTFKAYLRSVSV